VSVGLSSQSLGDEQDDLTAALHAMCTAGTCCHPVRELLLVLLAAHRRSLLAYDDDMDDRGTHAVIAEGRC
jgi:hypothetical protein